MLEQYDLTRETTPSISFPESHDTVRLMAEAKGNINALKQRYLFAAIFSAGVMFPMGFEFAFQKSLHVVKTSPEDWEQSDFDLRDYIRAINVVKRRYAIFQEESSNAVIPSENPDLLLLHKQSTQTEQEALVVLNKDLDKQQTFRAAEMNGVLATAKPLRPVLPADFPEQTVLDEDFSYTLDPGQGLLMVT